MTTKEIIKEIARKQNMTPKEVENEIRKAIHEAMKTTDPRAQALWKQMAPDGKEPSIDTFFAFCANMMDKNRGNGF